MLSTLCISGKLDRFTPAAIHPGIQSGQCLGKQSCKYHLIQINNLLPEWVCGRGGVGWEEDADQSLGWISPGVQILSISCSFWEKFSKIVCWRPPPPRRRVGPHLGEILDPPLNQLPEHPAEEHSFMIDP